MGYEHAALEFTRNMKVRMACTYAWAFVGKFYKWGGDDPSGFDCSGLGCELLQGVGLVGRKQDLTAAGLANLFKEHIEKVPYPGCLAFWGFEEPTDYNGSRIVCIDGVTYNVTHVEFCMDSLHSIGASGGGSTTLTEADAIKQNAFIKLRPILGGREAPLFFLDPFKALTYED